MIRPLLHPALAGIVRAVRAQAGGMTVILSAETTPWASMTLTGARHRIALRLAGAAEAGRLAAMLPEHDFALPGHLVADIGAVAAEGDCLRFDALTLEEG